MNELLVGTSGYVYPHWRNGVFYPPGLRQRDELAWYASRFRTVELNNPFYRLPEPESLDRWRDAVPEGFVFAVKASRYITHLKRLRDIAEPLALFLERATRLGRSLGPILFQLPPDFQADLTVLEPIPRPASGRLPMGRRVPPRELARPGGVPDPRRPRRGALHSGGRKSTPRPGDDGVLRRTSECTRARGRAVASPASSSRTGRGGFGRSSGPARTATSTSTTTAGGHAPRDAESLLSCSHRLGALRQRKRPPAGVPRWAPVDATMLATCSPPPRPGPDRAPTAGVAMSWCRSATCFSRSARSRCDSSTFRSSSRITFSCRKVAPDRPRPCGRARRGGWRAAARARAPSASASARLFRAFAVLLLRLVQRDPLLQELLVALGVLLLGLERRDLGFLLALLGQLPLGVEGRDLLLLHLDHRLDLALEALELAVLGVGLPLVELGLLDGPLDPVGRTGREDLHETEGAEGRGPAGGGGRTGRSGRRQPRGPAAGAGSAAGAGAGSAGAYPCGTESCVT